MCCSNTCLLKILKKKNAQTMGPTQSTWFRLGWKPMMGSVGLKNPSTRHMHTPIKYIHAIPHPYAILKVKG